MFTIEIDKRVKGKADTVWRILTDIKTLVEISPNITRAETISGVNKDMVRRMHHRNGSAWKEECKEWQALSHFTMQIETQNYPLPVTFIRRITSMKQKRNHVLLKICYEYTPKYGPLGYFVDKYHIRPVLTIFATQLINNLAKKINQEYLDSLTTAATILKRKKPVLRVSPETRISEICKILTEKCIGCVIVLNSQGNIVGMVSERDIINGISRFGHQLVLNKSASDCMMPHVAVCHPDDRFAYLLSIMYKKCIKYLPVVDDDSNLIGMISIDDILKYMSELEQESVIMNQYIEGLKWHQVTMQVGRSAAVDELG